LLDDPSRKAGAGPRVLAAVGRGHYGPLQSRPPKRTTSGGPRSLETDPMFKGSITALVTPMQNGSLDEEAFRGFVE
jgi:hypothetical protein